MSSDAVAIQVRNIWKTFAIYDKPIDRLKQMLFGRFGKRYFTEFHALKDISFDVKRGECVGIVGRNGAGKSTLLQIITGTLQPTSGAVAVHGRVAALLELGSGFNMEFTGRENVYMNASILGLAKDEIDANFQAIVDFADIGDFIDQPVKTYSTGMLLRLAFAVIAHVDADILIVDEALAVGDAFFQQKCMRFIRKFKEEHTILFVSHDTASVVNLCDRAVLLSHGELVTQGVSREVTDQYLQMLYAEQQDTQGTSAAGDAGAKRSDEEFRDQRQDFINSSNLRNDLRIMKFRPDAECFGDKAAEVVSVRFTDAEGRPLAWCVGGEIVQLEIKCRANKELFCPIVGYYIRDYLGQELFGDNTCLTTRQTGPLFVAAGEFYQATFRFRMPILKKGDYSVLVSAASGSQMEHVQHHWIYDALFFKSESDSLCGGMMGVPHTMISLRKIKE